jgi:hypothetical protein
MSITSHLKLAVVSLFKEAVEKDTRRFQNLAAFLGIDFSPKKKPEATGISKEASFEVEARAKGKVREEIRDWFMQIMSDYLPIGYFDSSKRDAIESRGKMYQYLPDDMFERMQRSLSLLVGTKARDSGYKELSVDDLVLDDEVVDNKIIDMLGYYQNNPSKLEATINKSFAPKKRETTDKRFEPGPGEMWFTPTVSQALYDNYKKYITDNKEKFSSKARKEGKDEIISPEGLGVLLNKADKHIIKILDEIKKFSVDIHDKDISYDPKEKVPTISITFSIPELAKRNKDLYSDVLFTKKLPASLGDLRANKEHPVSVVYSGDKGLGVRFEEKHKTWEENTTEAFKRIGFMDNASYKSFLTNMIYEFVKDNLSREKTLDDVISDLGGSIAIRGKKDSEGKPVTISSAQDLEEVMEFGGKDVTKQELKSKRKTEQVKKRYRWQDEMIKAKLERAAEVWGPKMQEYLFKLTPEDGKAMRESIVKSEKLESMGEFINKIKDGTDTKASFNGLIKTKEIAGKALQFIFDERTDPGQYAWKVLLTDYIKNEGIKSELFSDAIKLLLYKDFLESEGQEGAALKNKLKVSSWSDIKGKYSEVNVKDYLNKQSQGIADGIKFLSREIQDIIKKDSKNKPAFKTFFDRIRTWNDIVGKGLEPKIERILSGDDPSPVDISKSLKSKMISEYEEQDPRVKDEIEALEIKKDQLEKKLKASKEDLSKSEELKNLELTITNLKDKAVKKEKIDISVPGGSEYLDKLVDYLIEERLQKAYIKQASYINIIKLAKRLLK